MVTPDIDPAGPPNTVKLHILESPFIVASLRHTCAIIMLSNQRLDMSHREVDGLSRQRRTTDMLSERISTWCPLRSGRKNWHTDSISK